MRSGLLLAFFAFNIAPMIQTHSSKNPFNDEGTGLEIDMREVFFNVDGS